eukprot:5489618-Pyramimonas_sp.AAC.1
MGQPGNSDAVLSYLEAIRVISLLEEGFATELDDIVKLVKATESDGKDLATAELKALHANTKKAKFTGYMLSMRPTGIEISQKVGNCILKRASDSQGMNHLNEANAIIKEIGDPVLTESGKLAKAKQWGSLFAMSCKLEKLGEHFKKDNKTALDSIGDFLGRAAKVLEDSFEVAVVDAFGETLGLLREQVNNPTDEITSICSELVKKGSTADSIKDACKDTIKSMLIVMAEDCERLAAFKERAALVEALPAHLATHFGSVVGKITTYDLSLEKFASFRKYLFNFCEAKGFDDLRSLCGLVGDALLKDVRAKCLASSATSIVWSWPGAAEPDGVGDVSETLTWLGKQTVSDEEAAFANSLAEWAPRDLLSAAMTKPGGARPCTIADCIAVPSLLQLLQ